MNHDAAAAGSLAGSSDALGEPGESGGRWSKGDGGAEETSEQKPVPSLSGEASQHPSTYPLGFGSPFARWFFAIFSLLVIVLSIMVIRPFLDDIFIAFVLFILAAPIYRFFERLLRRRRTIASLMTCIAIVLILFVPFLLFTGVLASSAYDFYRYVTDELQSGELQKYLDFRNTELAAVLQKHVPALRQYEFDFNVAEVASKYLGTLSKFIYGQATSLAKGISSVFVGFLLVMFITFYMFLDGEKFLKELKALSPLEDRYDREILDELIKTVKVTFRGSLVVALVQGTLGAIGFLIAGIDSWALWGVVMVISSLIPIVGTALIWVPGVAYLYLTDHWVAGTFLLVWGVGVIGLADNLLRPFLMKGGTHLHPLLIFFSIMGGITYFGFLGILLGPLVFSLLVYVLRMYKKFMHSHKPGSA